MRRSSIRSRLTIWYSLALAAGLGCFAFAIWASMWHSLVSDLDSGFIDCGHNLELFLNQELSDPEAKLSEELDEYSHALPHNAFLRLEDERNSLVYTSNPAFPWRSMPPGNGPAHRVYWQQHTYRVMVRNIGVKGSQWRLTFAVSLDSIEALLTRLRLLLIALIPGVVVIATLGGTWLSRRALKPVDQITAAARSIGINNLSDRLVLPQTGDELQRLSETWNTMLSRLEDAVRRLSRFTADASHELRTPLAIIRSTAEIASRRSRSAETYREALRQIVLESERMTLLIEDLLFLARCDAEDLEMPMETLELEPLIHDVCSVMGPLADSKKIHLVAPSPKGAVAVVGNASAIRRLLLVLVDNALKYSKVGGRVDICLEETGGRVHLEIVDSGPGITGPELSRIFERFYRGSEARETGNSGSGLGLSLANGIAQHHRATIQVKSSPEQGSTFTVVFPAA